MALTAKSCRRLNTPKVLSSRIYHFAGHTPAFREEVAARARKDHGLRLTAVISPARWKASCHKHYVLTESNKA